MKKLIYLSIAAIITLSSCKSNAFMTQRYTKFGHSANKNSGNETRIAKSNHLQSIDPLQAEIKEQQEAEILTSSGSNALSENYILPAPQPFQANKSDLTITKKETEKTVQNKRELKSKKITSQKTQAAKKIVGTILKIILWIIILAVVVGIIIIIGLLA